MSVVMQIESSGCNSTHVAQPHYTSETSSNSSSSQQEENATQSVSTSVAPLLYTVTPASRTPGAGAQLVKVVSSPDGTGSQLIKVVSTATMASTSPGDGQATDVDTLYPGATVVQRAEDAQPTAEAVLSQRVYSLVPSGQKPQKSPYNNGQQRVQTVTALPANARVLPVSSPQKVQILSNVVVSKQNIMLNKSQRQVITSLAQKQLNNNTSAKATIVTAGKPGHAPVTTALNNLVITANQQPQGSAKSVTVNNTVVNQQKTLKTMNRAQVQPPKTIKTLSPQSPQGGYNQKQPGIKTLSPQINHYSKMPNQVKLIPAQPQVSPRGGIKTLAPQRANAVNTRPNAVTPKPNYIGKHAAQAQKVQKPGQGKGRAAGQRLASPTKYNAQKQQSQAVNSQSSFNQSLTAQILQSLPSSGSRGMPETVYHSTVKSYPQLQSPPDDTSLSEDIGEEVRPDFSPNLSYLYQVVMLDHNYGAPPPAVSPPIARQPIGQQPANTLNGTVTGSGGGQTPAGYYGTTVSGKRHGRLPANSTSTGPMSTSLPATHHISMPSGIDTRAPADDDAASTISSEGVRPEDGDEGEETETAPEGEGDEDGVTRCICDFDHDDGYMICCDICSSWQHVDCMGLDRDHIPDKYSCVRCEPRRVDRQHARTIQQRKREEFARIGGPPGTLVPGPTAGGVAGANSGSISDSSSETSTAESTGEGHPPAGTRHHSVSLNNNLIGKKRTTPVSLSTRRKSEPASQNRRAPLAHKRQQRRESAREAIVAGRRSAAMKKREKKQVLKRKMKSRSSVDDDSQDSWPPAATTAYSNSMGASLLQLRQWIENYEEAVTNHYSPELRARITNMRANGTHTSPHHDSKQAPPNAQADVAVQKCKVSSQPLTGLKIVMSTQSLAANSPVIELRGKYMLSTQHRASTGPPGSASGGLLTRQHAQRPGPFLFFYRLPRDGTEVCVDTRTYGNDARFIRRSCRPNAELRHCVEKGTLHLYVITIASIEKNSELTIKHESHDLAAAAASTATGTSTSIPCACGNPQQCGLFTNHRKNGGNMDEPVAANNSSATSQPSNSTSNTSSTSTVESKAPVEKLPVVNPATETNSSTTHRKRRGRRASSPGRSVSPPPVPEPLPSPGASHAPVQQPPPPALSTRRASSHHPSRATSSNREVEKEDLVPPQQQLPVQPPQPQQQQSSQPVAPRERSEKSASDSKDKKKKLTREERKMEAIMKAFERLEKAEQRKQEVQARQAQRRESDPSPSSTAITTHAINRHQQENGDLERESMRTRRKKRKGRSRTISTTSQSSTRRRTRVNSTDSYMTSGDESSLLSPPLPISQEPALTPEPKHVDVVHSRPLAPESPVKSLSNSQASELSSPSQVNTAAGLLLALANGGTTSNEQSMNKSPEADGNSSGSNSSVQSSPGTPLSSACLLVAAAVGPLEPGFKFPKTKKAIMNEWLNKSPEPVQPVSSMSPMMTLHQATVLDQTDLGPQLPATDYYNVASTANKSLATLVQAASLCDSPPQGAKAAMMGQGVGNAKKRWLRQAISEECDSPCSRPESPPGNAEMVAPPKKRRLARESLSSEQSFTPPTTPTMLVPPSNSLVEEDYPNNDEEFYTTEDRNVSNSSPPIQADFQKPITKDTVSHQRLEIGYTEHIHSTSAGASEMTLQHTELEPDNGLKDRCAEMQLEFGVITSAVKREDVMDTITKKYPDTLSTSLLDPRLGRDRPIFRDSAQLLGTVEKTIRFYEENLTGPVPQVIQLQDEPKEKLQGKPEMVTPAKRKLSISEYRQRKQLSTGTGGGSSGGGGTPERPASPETPPPGGVRGPRGRSDSTSSATSSLSSDEEALGTATVDPVKPAATVEPQVAVAFNSAPTAVERQRENVERLKKVFGLALDDDGRKTSVIRTEPPQPAQKTTVSPSVQPSSSTDVGKPTSVVVAPVITPTVDTKYSAATVEPAKTEPISKRPSPDTTYATVQNEEVTKMDVEEVKKVEQHGDDDLGYARFDETVSTSFIPPFNNPVYPNSTQFTSFTSVIDTCPYEGRNPSPPPPDMLTTSNNRSYPMSSGNSALTMSPTSASYK